MRWALIGAGRAGAHLALALREAGAPPVALGARDPARAAPLAAALALPVLSPQAAAEQADTVLLAVRDDALQPLCSALRWRAGQCVLHLSGATSLDALQAARDGGARAAGFHPLLLMADPLPSPAAAAAALRGVYIGIEADEALDHQQLQAWAQRLGATALALRPGQRALYHAAANAAASGLLAPLSLALRCASEALGCSPAEAWAALSPLAHSTLAAAQQHGVAQALSGPVRRGDEAVLHAHEQALTQRGDAADAALYNALIGALRRLR